MIDPRLIPIMEAHELLYNAAKTYADAPAMRLVLEDIVRRLGSLPAPEL